MPRVSFLDNPEITPESQHLFDEDTTEYGYVMNASRVWAYQPATLDALFDLMRAAGSSLGLTVRQRGIVIGACASAFGDAYCSLAWGRKLAAVSDPETAAGVLRGEDSQLTDLERALARWARKVAENPNATTTSDVDELRAAGYDDAQIFAVTVLVSLRIAFSVVNDAVGTRPDAQLRSAAPQAVLDAVTFGRPIADHPS